MALKRFLFFGILFFFFNLIQAQDTLLINYKGRLTKFTFQSKNPEHYPKLMISGGFGMEKRPFTSPLLLKKLEASYDLFHKVELNAFVENPILPIWDDQYTKAIDYTYSSNDLKQFVNYGFGTDITFFSRNKPKNTLVHLGKTTVDGEVIKLSTHVVAEQVYNARLSALYFYERSTILHQGNFHYDGVFQVMNHVNFDQKVLQLGLNFSMFNYVVGEIIKLKKVETIRKLEVYFSFQYALEQNLEDIEIEQDFWISHLEITDSTGGNAYDNPLDDEQILAGTYPLNLGVDYEIYKTGWQVGMRYQDLTFNNRGYTLELAFGNHPGFVSIENRNRIFYKLNLTFDIGFFGFK